MPRSARRSLCLAVSTACASLLSSATASAQIVQAPSSGDRVLGLDVSAWQTEITTTEWATLKRPTNQQVNGVSGDGRDFVFIRSSRGGTTGYYNQSNADNDPPTNTLSQRYDDPYYIQNITRATRAGLLAGSYHFSRPDIVASTLNANGIPNNGTDEADHFIQMAGPWMRPGFLLPVHDLEAGISQRTRDGLTQFALDFSNRIYQVMQIRPAIYINGGYTDYVNGASASLRNQLPTAYPTLWVARWPNQSDPNSIDVQNSSPKATYANFYGPWNALGTEPWVFWQYASTARLNGNNLGGSNTDVNVAQGNIEFVKDQLVPAVWMNGSSGDWHNLANWNSGQTPVAPVQGPGQVARVGTLVLPTPRLPGTPDASYSTVTGADDTVNLNRPSENITVTLSQGTYNIRRLNLNETLVVTGGNLDARLTGWVGTGGTLRLEGGNVTFDRALVTSTGVLNFNGAGTLNVGRLELQGNPTFTGAGGTGNIMGKPGVVSPVVDLLGGTRTFTVGDGTASTDMRIWIPLTNGSLTKAGAGTLELTGNNSAFAGNLSVTDGYLLLTNPNQIGTSGVQTTQTTATTGGAVRLSGNGLNFTRTITVGGLGANNSGALENVSGSNTWSGNVVLNGAQHNQNQIGLNQIGAAAGTTLTLSGVVQNGAGSSWAKVGAGDLVLGGASPNLYTNLTRVFGGRIIIEKDGALGAAGNSTIADGNTFQLPGVDTAIAFRAPSGSPGLNYNTVEWIFTEGGGISGAQIDNLGGNNTFAGHLGFGGTTSPIAVAGGSSLEVKGGLYARSTTTPQARSIIKRGTGTLILSGDSTAAPTNGSAKSLVNSSFAIEAGTVQLKGTASNGPNVVGVTSWQIGSGGTLSLAKSGAVGGAATVAFGGGTLRAETTLADAAALAFTGNGTLDAGTGVNATFTGATSGGDTFGLTKTGAGSVTLGGAVNTFRSAFNVNGGTLRIGPNGGNSGVANARTLSITGSARFDLSDNDLIVRGTPAATVEQMVAAGYNGGAWDGTNAIVSSTAASNQWIYTLGVADNARLQLTSFGGHAGLAHTEALVKYTYYGDADLSGAVNAADFARFQAGFANEMPDAWLFGDFNYSGVVDAADFSLFLYGFHNQPGSTLTTEFANQMITFAIDNDLDYTLVPEPANLALLALGAGALVRRRRPHVSRG